METWTAIKRHSFAALATILVNGYRDAKLRDLVSSGRVALQTSRDPVARRNC
jgi:hypothetical protein